MIKYLEYTDIDIGKWDHCIDLSINGIIYPYSFYLDQVCPGWSALILDDYQAVMPLPGKTKMGINYIMQPPFVQQLGVFSPHPVTEEVMKEFLDSIPLKYLYLNVNLNTFNPLHAGFQNNTSKGITYELDLIEPYEQLKTRYSAQTQRNLKKAQRENLFIVKNNDPLPVIDAFKNNKGKETGNFTPKHYKMFKNLVFSLIYKGMAEVYSAFDNNNSFCAGIIFFTSHKKSVLIFSGSMAVARKNGAMTAILDHFIRENAENHLILDFEGSTDKNLARFYAGFGSKECVFLRIENKKFPSIFKPFANLYLWLKQLC